MIKNKLLDNFQRLVRHDVRGFLNNAADFFNSDYLQIQGYYNGNIKDFPKDSFSSYNNIRRECDVIKNLIAINVTKFTTEYWDLVDFVDNIDSKLKTTENLSKWLRSNKTSTSYDTGTSFNYTMRGNESLDESVRNVLGNVDEEQINDIAIKNDIEERDFDTKGGKDLTIYSSATNISNIIQVTTIVDNPLGKRIYGKDIAKKFEWADDDIKVLSYDDTLKQTIYIHSNTFKGTVPENEGIGIDIFVGKNVRLISKPLIIRQLNEVFGIDDIFSGILIKRFDIEADGIYIDYTIKTILGEQKPQKLLL